MKHAAMIVSLLALATNKMALGFNTKLPLKISSKPRHGAHSFSRSVQIKTRTAVTTTTSETVPDVQGIYQARGRRQGGGSDPASTYYSSPSPRLGSPLPKAPSSTVIIGAGPTGLATAIMLARRGWQNISVFDRLPPPPDPDDEATFSNTARFYLIGLGSRGQKALQVLDAWDEVEKYTSKVVGRKDFSQPGQSKAAATQHKPTATGAEGGSGEGGHDDDGGDGNGDSGDGSTEDLGGGQVKLFTDRPYSTHVIARERLAGVLARLIDEEYGDQVKVMYQVECTSVAWNDDDGVEAADQGGVEAGEDRVAVAGVGGDQIRVVVKGGGEEGGQQLAGGGEVGQPSSSIGLSAAEEEVVATVTLRFRSSGSAEEKKVVAGAEAEAVPAAAAAVPTAAAAAATTPVPPFTTTTTVVPTPFLVGADGAAREVAASIERRQSNAGRVKGERSSSSPSSFGAAAVCVTRFEDDNVRVYKTVPFTLPIGACPPAATAAEAAASVEVNEALLKEKEGELSNALLLLASSLDGSNDNERKDDSGSDDNKHNNKVASSSSSNALVVATSTPDAPATAVLAALDAATTAADAPASAVTDDAAAAAAAVAASRAQVKDAKLKLKWRCDVNYSCRSSDGRIVFDALPASSSKGEYCGVLLLREDDELAQANCPPSLLRAVLDSSLPQFSSLLNDQTLKEVAAKPPSRLPAFRYVGPSLHSGGNTVLLGDAIHTVKPYFGLGANSALEDVIALQSCLDQSPLDHPASALKHFSKLRGPEAKALVTISRGFDRPGTLGLLTFVLPLILDGIFHKLAPQLFAPNTIAFLQKEGVTFSEVARVKRRDRAIQLVVVSTVVAAALTAVGLAAVASLASLALVNPLAKVTSVGKALAALLSSSLVALVATNPVLVVRSPGGGVVGAAAVVAAAGAIAAIIVRTVATKEEVSVVGAVKKMATWIQLRLKKKGRGEEGGGSSGASGGSPGAGSGDGSCKRGWWWSKIWAGGLSNEDFLMRERVFKQPGVGPPPPPRPTSPSPVV